jgi:hypothetical protein
MKVIKEQGHGFEARQDLLSKLDEALLRFGASEELDSLPIQGGWGYEKATACVIDSGDPRFDSADPYFGIAVEYAFIEARIRREIRQAEEKDRPLKGEHWLLQDRTLVHEGRLTYDHLAFDLVFFTEAGWQELAKLRREIADPNEFAQERDFRAVHVRRDFWFDISRIGMLCREETRTEADL